MRGDNQTNNYVSALILIATRWYDESSSEEIELFTQGCNVDRLHGAEVFQKQVIAAKAKHLAKTVFHH